MDSGIVIYCVTHDQGAIVLTDKKIENIKTNKICCSNDCRWEKHGSCDINNNIISFGTETQEYYDMYGGGWKNQYFKKSLYDKNYNEIDTEPYIFIRYTK